MDLDTEVERFHTWTRRTRQRASCWGQCYPHMESLYEAVRATVEGGSLTPETADQLLMLLVVDRDNERVLDLLGASPMLSFQLAQRGRSSPDPMIRCQLALLLGRTATLGAIEALRDMSADPEPNVRSCAMRFLRDLDPAFTLHREGGD